MITKIAILAARNIDLRETESASFPPSGLSNGKVIVGMEVINPTKKVEFVLSKTYQLTIVPRATKTEKPNPLAIK
tara:strand:+ start:185 stop:409 length:225 start_codon:yes stop_codon:yes gene_type:complete